jgi:pimeloyl-ACP methyl ester carboxylesterase
LVNQLGVSDDVLQRFVRRTEQRIGFRWEDLDGRRLAANMTAPLFIIHDRDDVEVPIVEGETLASAWPGSRLLETVGLGHRRVLRDAEVVRQATDFIKAK